MPSFRGNMHAWNLGKPSFASRISKHTARFPPTNTSSSDDFKIAPDNSQCITCSQCCDYSQTNLHTAKAIVLNCMVFTFFNYVLCRLKY